MVKFSTILFPTILSLMILSSSPTALGGGFHAFCNKQVVVVQKKFVAVQAVPNVYYAPHYYVPGTPYRQASYLTDEERIAKISARVTVDILKQMNMQAVHAEAQQKFGVFGKCARCHSEGGPNAGAFLLPAGPISPKTAARIKFGIESKGMDDKAGLTPEETGNALRETTKILLDYFSQEGGAP